jgi:hypothetical protein
MEQLAFALEGAWKVLLVGLILGAGLPAVFAAGVRSLAWGVGGDAEVSHASPNPTGRILAALLFAIVGYAVISGILFVIASGQGKALDFTSVVPTFVDKK